MWWGKVGSSELYEYGKVVGKSVEENFLAF